MGMNAIDSLEISPEGDILYIDSRAENDPRVALIAAEDYLQAIASPIGPSCRVEVVGSDVLSPEPGQIRAFARGAAFVPKAPAQPAAAGAAGAEGPSADEVRAACYETINSQVTSPAVEDAVARLADTFEPPARANLLRNLARQYSNRPAGAAAARLLVRDMTASGTDAFRLQDLALEAPTAGVMREVSQALDRFFAITIASEAQPFLDCAIDLIWRDCPTGQGPAVAAMFMACGRQLLRMKAYSQVEDLCRTAEGSVGAAASGELARQAQQLLAQSRLASEDVIGAMAAVARDGEGVDRAVLLGEWAGTKDLSVLEEHVRKLVTQVLEAAKAIGPSAPKPADLFSGLAASAEEIGLWPVAAGSWREVVRLHQVTVLSAADGKELQACPGVASAVQAAAFWKGHAFLAMGQAERAAEAFRRLVESGDAKMRGQALYDLAQPEGPAGAYQRGADVGGSMQPGPAVRQGGAGPAGGGRRAGPSTGAAASDVPAPGGASQVG